MHSTWDGFDGLYNQIYKPTGIHFKLSIQIWSVYSHWILFIH